MPATVGVLANPASGRDIRRLVTSASVFDNAEKANMVVRLMSGLAAAGVERILMMPTAGSIIANLERRLPSRRRSDGQRPLPELAYLDMDFNETAQDSVIATRLFRKADVGGIAVLGGDGTHRVVARHSGPVPLLALSTGTNNAFPEMREATVGGLALGLVATGRVPYEQATRHHCALRVRRAAADTQYALVDVAVSRDRFVGARAVWRPEEITEVFTAFADPTAVGISAVAGLLWPLPRGGKVGLHVTFAPPAEADIVLTVPFAPGLVTEVGVLDFAVLPYGQEVAIAAGAGALALDGEREIERGPEDRITVRLDDGPVTVDVERTLRYAATHSVLRAAKGVMD